MHLEKPSDPEYNSKTTEFVFWKLAEIFVQVVERGHWISRLKEIFWEWKGMFEVQK